MELCFTDPGKERKHHQRPTRPLSDFLVAQCSATPATVAATPPCSATPFQTQISVRHLRGQGGRCDTIIFRGCSATPALHLQNSLKSLSLSPGHRAKITYGVYHFLGKQGKMVYTIGPERVHTIEASDPEKIRGHTSFQERKSSPKSKFWGRISGGRPRGYPGGHPGAKTSVKPSKPWKNKHFGADAHDPKARTSMTPGGLKKLRSEKLRAEFFPEGQRYTN